MSYNLITAKSVYAITLEEAKRHLKELTTDNDAYIQDLIIAAQQKVEEEYDLSLTAETWELLLDEFPEKAIEIYMWPIASPITSVKYTDGNGDTQQVTSTYYETDLVGKPARIYPVDSYSWPDVKDTVNAVQVRFVTGFTSPETIPGDIKQAMLLIIRDWFDNRADKGRRFTRVSEMILNKYRYR
jgi:uncharacterized phiE125 gp8 family phage protein